MLTDDELIHYSTLSADPIIRRLGELGDKAVTDDERDMLEVLRANGIRDAVELQDALLYHDSEDE